MLCFNVFVLIFDINERIEIWMGPKICTIICFVSRKHLIASVMYNIADTQELNIPDF